MIFAKVKWEARELPSPEFLRRALSFFFGRMYENAVLLQRDLVGVRESSLRIRGQLQMEAVRLLSKGNSFPRCQRDDRTYLDPVCRKGADDGFTSGWPCHFNRTSL